MMAEQRKRLRNFDYDSMKFASHILERKEMNYAKSKDEIKAGIMKQFEDALDEELSKLPHNCGLGFVFRFDRVTKDGKVITVNKSERCSEDATEWRNAVFERDKFKCVECGRDDKLHAHHISRWADNKEGRYCIDNGITLCVECHALKHPENPNFIRNAKVYKGE
jgi:hypothetical protein